MADPRAVHAPAAYEAHRQLEADIRGMLPAELLDTARRRVAMSLDLDEWKPPDGPVEAFTDQFVIDVSSVDVGPLAAQLGEHTGPFVQALWVLDLGTRTDVAVERLFGAPVPPRPPAEPGDFAATFDEYLRVVAQLSNLDPITTELVRLRGARFHNCRICKSRRVVSALREGADEAMFDKIDLYESSDLDERYKVALRLTDAIITQPKYLDEGLAAQTHAHFDDAQLVELVCDVMRNAANKVAVAFGADAPNVTSGVELFDVLPDGNLVYGLSDAGS